MFNRPIPKESFVAARASSAVAALKFGSVKKGTD
jgi:hypothetical protein